MPRTPLLCGVRKRNLSRTGSSEGKGSTSSRGSNDFSDSWYVEQAFVFGDLDIDNDVDIDMRRTSARSHWDADASLDHRESLNLSPRSQQLHDEHLPLAAGCGDDMLGGGDHLGGGGGMGAAGGLEAGNGTASPRAGVIGAGGGGGGGETSPRSARDGGGHSGGGHGSGRRRGGKRSRRRFFLRIHKFVFQTELALHLSMCILSIAIPFSLSGSPWLAAIPVSVWCFYNAMFVMGAKRASTVLPGFDRFKRSFVAAMEEFLPPRLVPVLSLSFLSVIIAVTLTAARLGGPPLCISSCRTCLGSWKHAHPVAPLRVSDASAAAPPGSAAAASRGSSPRIAGALDHGAMSVSGSHWLEESAGGASRSGGDGFLGAAGAAAGQGSLRSKNGEACGYANGKELLAYYTVSQSAILIYLAVMTGLLTCLAWKVSEEELAQRQAAESRLKAQNPRAFELRERMILDHGRPGSSVRPETTGPWLMFGLVAACTFTLIGWRKWGDLPLTAVTVVVVMANVTTTLASVLMLHVGFHGRLIALYQGNLHRVQFLSKLLREGTGKAEEPWVYAAEAWWFLRSFVLREDLSLDYDVGGLGVSATFLIVLASFVVAIAQIVREGRDAMLNPPGSYCAYASVYLTVCLIRIFGLATKTYLEQQLHVGIIQEYIDNLASVASKMKTKSMVTSKAATFPSGLKKERGQPSSPAASLSGGTKPNTGTADAVAVAAAATSSAKAQQNALALARVAVTGTSVLGGDPAGADVDGGEARHTSGGGAAGGAGRTGGGQGGDGGGAPRPHPAQDAMRRMIVHINTSDPYPCVLGVPVKPALFATSKIYVFVCFAVISVMLMYDVVCDMV